MTGAGVDPGGLESDMQAFGITAQVPATTESSEFMVLPENFRAVEVFAACNTQWRYAGMTGTCTGLDYTALSAVMAMLGIEDAREIRDTFERVRLIESGALDAMREKQS
ncbi:MAG: DUF1799 domain-containing protein [Marinobacter sp.]|nr:DUF1799 domain-containing protein [Marinobacter sp.]